MWHHLNKDDFARTSELGLEQRQALSLKEWKVCQEGYDLQDLPEPGYSDDYRLVAKCSWTQEDKWRTYYPLEDTPDLFLSFARLYEDRKIYFRGLREEYVSYYRFLWDTPDLAYFAQLYYDEEEGDKEEDSPTDPVLAWVRRYGVLGYGRGEDEYGRGGYQGGPEDTIDTYYALAYEAAGILAMYEAALNGDQEAAKDVVLRDFLPVDPVGYDFKSGNLQKAAAPKAANIEENFGGSYVEYALHAALFLVMDKVREECLPTLYLPEGVEDPSKVSAGLRFKSLYGAMYLQLYWLMASGGNVTRCRYDGRIISLASPAPGARKPRQDKKFCNDACRQRYHYHTKTKPRRQGESQ